MKKKLFKCMQYLSHFIFRSHKFKSPRLHFSSIWAYVNQFLVKRPYIFVLSRCVFHWYMKKSNLNVRFSHFVSRSQKFKLPCLHLSPMWAYTDHFILFECPFPFFAFNRINKKFYFECVFFIFNHIHTFWYEWKTRQF